MPATQQVVHAITKKRREDVAFRLLAAENFSAHRTMREFRALDLSDFTELSTQVVRLAGEMDLVKPGTIATNGAKIEASAKWPKRHQQHRYCQALSIAKLFVSPKVKWTAEIFLCCPDAWCRSGDTKTSGFYVA